MASEARAPLLMLVDDDPLVSGAIASFLRDDGHDVREVATGEDALADLDAAAPDLVLLDVGLPGISGFETLRLLRLRSDVPVVMLTAASEINERHGSSAAPATPSQSPGSRSRGCRPARTPRLRA